MNRVSDLIRRLDLVQEADLKASLEIDWPAVRARTAIWREHVQAVLRGELAMDSFMEWQTRVFDEQQPVQTRAQKKLADRLRTEILDRLKQTGDRLRREGFIPDC